MQCCIWDPAKAGTSIKKHSVSFSTAAQAAGGGDCGAARGEHDEVSLARLLGKTTRPVEPELLDAFVRLAETAEDPALAPLLGESLVREIHCRLLLGPFGRALRELNTGGTQGERILETLAWLKEDYRKPCAMPEPARRANMAPSTFHKYFKEITAVSPLQYQKRLRPAGT